MRYYRPEDDWITYLESDFRAEAIATLRGLRLERLQKYPPPKLTQHGGLPFGNEARVLERFVRGESSQLDASAFSKHYLGFASDEEQHLYEAFRKNTPLTRAEWATIIGAENVDKWVEHKFLRIDEDDHLVLRFGVVALDGLIYLVDPLNDHGGPHQTVMLPEDFKPGNGDTAEQFNHTYIGLDSLRQIEYMSGERIRKGRRYLDCGPGAGAILLYFARKFDEAVGVEINPRSATLASFNAELNELPQCHIHLDNAVTSAGNYGQFDLVSWNLPFMFMPDDEADRAVDAYGGELGIGLCLEFIEVLPKLIADKGFAFLAALSPILTTGENVLETKLKERLSRLGLDCRLIVAQVSLAHTKDLWDFHRSHSIDKFESVYLHLTHGTGKFERVEAPLTRKMLDKVRYRMYQKKFA